MTNIKKQWLFCRMVIALFVLLAATPGFAELTPMDDNCLEDICGRSGISLAVKNVQIFHHIDTIGYCATDNGSVEFQNFSMHGSGDVALFNYDFGTVTDSGIIHLDAFLSEIAPVNDWSGSVITGSDTVHRGMTSAFIPNWDQELAYTIGNIAFYDPNYSVNPVDLGAFTIGLIDMPRSATYTSPRINGSGFDFQHSFQMSIDTIGYAYNTNCNAIEFTDIYIGGSFADLAGDDPRTPSTWKPNQAAPVDFGDFQIGDLFGDAVSGIYSNPATIDAGKCDIYNNGVIYGLLDLKLPMTGSIRFESADFNGTDFGPGAIDGMEIHRLNLQLIP